MAVSISVHAGWSVCVPDCRGVSWEEAAFARRPAAQEMVTAHLGKLQLHARGCPRWGRSRTLLLVLVLGILLQTHLLQVLGALDGQVVVRRSKLRKLASRGCSD